MPPRRVSEESQKRGTATEHAKEPLVLQHNPETLEFMEEAMADQADDSKEQLMSHLNGFLTYVVQKMYPFIAHLQSDFADIDDMVCEKVSEWERTPRENAYNHYELLVHKKIWDVVTCNKDGSPKDHDFAEWCKKIALCADSVATEHAEPFRILVKDICAKELTQAQKKNPKYQLREGATISNELRSLVNVILRKNLGDSRVAHYILENGIPTLLDVSLLRHPLQTAKMETLLEELMVWHASMLQWLDNRQNDADTIIAQKLSDPRQDQWQANRRHRKKELQQQLRQGKDLAKLRDSKQKRFHEMSATEQRVLEDYETGEAQKIYDMVKVRKWR